MPPYIFFGSCRIPGAQFVFTKWVAKVMFRGMTIVTKQGDAGKTRLYSGEEVSKGDARLNTFGTLDELVSFLGLARAFCNDDALSNVILKKQKILFRLGTELATRGTSKVKVEPINTRDVQDIDDLLVDTESKVKLAREFVIPGSGKLSAFLDVARTVCRRLEREMVNFAGCDEWKNDQALIYINRLSDLLFLLARKVQNG